MAESSERLGPEDMEAWSGAAMSLLSNAKAVASEWHETSKDSDITRSGSPALGFTPHVDRGPKAQNVFDAKLVSSKTGLEIAEASLQRCSAVLLKLQHERQSKWAAFKVCEWRLALRARRPPEELFRDHLQEALEHEMEILTASRQTLADRVAEAKVAAEDCEANRVRLLRNVRLMVCSGEPNPPPFEEASADEAHLGTSSVRTSLQESGMSAEQIADLEANDIPPGPPRPPVPADAEGLVRRAPQLRDMSILLLKKGEAIIEKEKLICEKASLKSTSAFHKRSAENNAMRKDLESQIAEMDRATATAELSISRMKKRILHFKEIELQPKVAAVEKMVEKLAATREELEADLTRKVVSIRIDDSCRKITPARSLQDPMTMPVMSLLAPKPKSPPKGRRREKNMKRQSSSPAIVGNEIDSAVSTTSLPQLSPAGSSSTLKAVGNSLAS